MRGEGGRGGLRETLKDKLPKELLHFIPSSFDIIGSREGAVAIIELPEELNPYEKVVAEALMKTHKNVRSVLRKLSGRTGAYRLREFKLLLGEDNTEVIHKEHGCLFKLDPRKVYFSPREATERVRIAKQVKPNELILVMFSGVGPYPIIIAKKQPQVRKIYAIELNKEAHQYCIENIKLNKLENKIVPFLGDVREICPTLAENFHRVVMPLPKGAYQFLDLAIPRLRRGGILHFYHWASEEDLFTEAEKLVKEAAERFGREIKVLNRVRVLPYKPRTWKICIDAEIL